MYVSQFVQFVQRASPSLLDREPAGRNRTTDIGTRKYSVIFKIRLQIFHDTPLV